MVELLDTVDCLARLVVNETITTYEVFLFLTRLCCNQNLRPQAYLPNYLRINAYLPNYSSSVMKIMRQYISSSINFFGYPFLYGYIDSFGPLCGVGN